MAAGKTKKTKKEKELEAKKDPKEKKTDPPTDKEKKTYSEEEIEKLREEYLEVVGKKPHHKAGPEKLIEGINASKAE